MKNKVWIVLTVIFLSQLIISCCDCSSTLSYKNTYTGVSITPYDISGFNSTEVDGKAYKNAFGLGVSVNFDSEAYAKNTNPLSNVGFSFAMAMSCDCVGDDFVYTDPISNLLIRIQSKKKMLPVVLKSIHMQAN